MGEEGIPEGGATATAAVVRAAGFAAAVAAPAGRQMGEPVAPWAVAASVAEAGVVGARAVVERAAVWVAVPEVARAEAEVAASEAAVVVAVMVAAMVALARATVPPRAPSRDRSGEHIRDFRRRGSGSLRRYQQQQPPRWCYR